MPAEVPQCSALHAPCSHKHSRQTQRTKTFTFNILKPVLPSSIATLTHTVLPAREPLQLCSGSRMQTGSHALCNWAMHYLMLRAKGSRQPAGAWLSPECSCCSQPPPCPAGSVCSGDACPTAGLCWHHTPSSPGEGEGMQWFKLHLTRIYRAGHNRELPVLIAGWMQVYLSLQFETEIACQCVFTRYHGINMYIRM